MITIRKSGDRGRSALEWLDSRHTFSFAEYYDQGQMGFESLRVINDDHIAPGGGFPPHPHRDMEIVTYVTEGALAHRDSMGNGSTIRRGDVQRMSAGTGVTHSEYNASRTDPAHLLQIWIVPDRRGYQPGYEQKHFADEDKRGRMRVAASPDGRDGSVSIHQDALMYAGIIEPGQPIRMAIAAGRNAYLHVVEGGITVNGAALKGGDGARIENEREITLDAAKPSEVILFDVAQVRA
jgi:redox-sensitive bicupin YhaK (pirin superfamily)